MILEYGKQIEVVKNTEGGTSIGVDQSSIHVLQMLLSQGLYSDAETAVIAEYAK